MVNWKIELKTMNHNSSMNHSYQQKTHTTEIRLILTQQH